MREYRAKRRAEAVAYLGGQCVICGSSDEVEFHHIDPETKISNISGFAGSKTAFWEEVEKCELRCHEHHTDVTFEMTMPDHGTYARRRRGCRCVACDEAWRVKRREHNLSWRGRI